MTALAFTAYYAGMCFRRSPPSPSASGHVTRGNSNAGGVVSRVFRRVEDAIRSKSSPSIIRRAVMTDPEANLAIARRITAAFEQGDDATLRELYAPNHLLHNHWHDPLPLPGNDDQPVLNRYQ
jgi:hypothetical protein